MTSSTLLYLPAFTYDFLCLYLQGKLYIIHNPVIFCFHMKNISYSMKNTVHKTHCKIISSRQQSKFTLSGNKSQCEKVGFPKLLWSFYSLTVERERTPKHRSLITNSSVPQDHQRGEGMNNSPVSDGGNEYCNEHCEGTLF